MHNKNSHKKIDGTLKKINMLKCKGEIEKQGKQE
jgi:hypothetical protein